MSNLDPFQVPDTPRAPHTDPVPAVEGDDYWKALSRRHERRQRKSRQLLTKIRDDIDAALREDPRGDL